MEGDRQRTMGAATRAAAAASDQDQDWKDTFDDLATLDRQRIEMALERRWDQVRRETAATCRAPQPAASAIFRVMSQVRPLPGQMHAALNIAHGELRRCLAAIKRAPTDPVAAQNLASAEAQLARFNRRAGLA